MDAPITTVDTADCIRLTLPLPPSANVYWRNYRGRMVVSEAARQYKALVYVLAYEAGITPLQGDLILTLHFHFIRSTADLDNRLKVGIDSLNQAAWGDDKQIVEIHAYRHLVPKAKRGQKREGYVVVTVQRKDVL